MNYKRIAELLTDQLNICSEREKSLSEQNRQQSILIENLTIQISKLTDTIASLEEVLLQKNGDTEKLNNKNRGLSKLLYKGSEKITPKAEQKDSTPEVLVENRPAFSAKDRGNNNAKRKDHFYLETKYHHQYPQDIDFDKEKARYLDNIESIRYEYIPPKFIKNVYVQHRYSYSDKIYIGKAPKAPLNNSNFDASFIAGIIELRYIYSMPIERIVKLFNDSGFELSKSTAHGLLKKAFHLLEKLESVLNKEVLKDNYLCMDESYYTILTQEEKNKNDKFVKKGYIWAALANNLKLIYYFYKNGSRKQEVLLEYLEPGYKGAIQTDGLANYKILETDQYPDIIRISCFQHCKRQFIDIENDQDAIKIVNIINKLYQKEHEIAKNWSKEKILQFRQKYAPPILKELKDELLKIQANPQTLPKSLLSKATNYTLKEYDSLCNYIKSADYALDNNAIERNMRYISLSRKNSLFCGSHEGAERAAFFYSLACSCRLNGINVFQYFTDILNQIINIPPNADDEVYRRLLPNMWGK